MNVNEMIDQAIIDRAEDMEIADLVTLLKDASEKYHNTGAPIMSDATYDTLLEILKEKDPYNDFISTTGALPEGTKVVLPVPLPSCDKANDASLERFVGKFGDNLFMISVKLDGISVLRHGNRLFTRGDGIQGEDITHVMGAIIGCPQNSGGVSVRGELMIREDSRLMEEDKLSRNIVAGLKNRDEISEDHKELHFVAYEVVIPANLTPSEQFIKLTGLGYEVADHRLITQKGISELASLFEEFEEGPYKLDGLVIQPDKARPEDFQHEIRRTGVACPKDKLAWKPIRGIAHTRVIEVKWQVSPHGLFKPVVVFEPVHLSGANCTNVTAHNAFNVIEKGIGPGAIIGVRRSGDTIPYLHIVLESTNPSFPPGFFGVGKGRGGPETEDEEAINLEWYGPDIKLIDREHPSVRKAMLKKALSALGTDNIGESIIFDIYHNFCDTYFESRSNDDEEPVSFGNKGHSYDDLEIIYNLSRNSLKKLNRVGDKKAEQIYLGLRAESFKWTELNLMLASNIFPRLFGKSKLSSILEVIPNYKNWTIEELVRKCPRGIAPESIIQVAGVMPNYIEWRRRSPTLVSMLQEPRKFAEEQATIQPTGFVFVLSSIKSKAALTALLEAKGHTVKENVTKCVTHVISGGGSSIKTKAAEEKGIPIITIEQAKAF
jgi:NAD-dependent DNA ligase